MANLVKIAAWISEIDSDPGLLFDSELTKRQAALETLERVQILLHYSEASQEKDLLQQRATRLETRLRQIHMRYADQIRVGINSGSLPRIEIRNLFTSYSAYRPEHAGMEHSTAETLDLLINELLDIKTIPPETRAREAEMAHLDMLPASAVLDMIDHARIGESDCFYDLGAGLGQPAILVNLLCGAKAVGIEYQPSYIEFAQSRAEMLGLSEITFITEDARQVDYSDGTVFLLFSPFKGAILERVMEKLQHEPRDQHVRICSFGPCSEVLYRQGWLKKIYPDSMGEFKLVVFTRRNRDAGFTHYQ